MDSSVISTGLASSGGVKRRGRNRLIDKVEEITESETAKNIAKRFDLYPKSAPEAIEKTTSGAVVSVITAVFIGILFISEFISYISITRKDSLSVDTSVGGKLNIDFNITFPSIPCSELRIDTVDASGDQQINIDYKVFKNPVTPDVKIIPIDKRIQNKDGETLVDLDPSRDPSNPNYCGPCYLPIGKQKPGKCCKTCEDVMNEHRTRNTKPPPIGNIEQCVKDLMDSNPGCNMHGNLEVHRVTGNFHFAPGRSFMQAHQSHVHHVHEFNPRTVSRFNSTHIIHKLWFGEKTKYIDSPLDGTSKSVKEDNALFKYFIKVVPTSYKKGSKVVESNQFSSTYHMVQFKAWQTTSYIPGVFFVYDLSPIMITYEDTRDPFTHFIVKLSAVIGGIFAVSGHLSKLVNYVLSKFK